MILVWSWIRLLQPMQTLQKLFIAEAKPQWRSGSKAEPKVARAVLWIGPETLAAPEYD